MEFHIKRNIDDKDKEYLYKKIQEYNHEYFERAGFQNLGVTLENEEKEIVAGLSGIIRGRWLLIQSLWVQEDLRRQKIGSELLKRAEYEAKENGCEHVLLDTFEFQAPLFYEKFGYKEVFVFEEHPITGKHYYLSKDL